MSDTTPPTEPLKIQPADKTLLENLKDWATVALAVLGVIYATGWLLRSFSMHLSGVGPVEVSHQSSVAAGLAFAITLLPIAAVAQSVRADEPGKVILGKYGTSMFFLLLLATCFATSPIRQSVFRNNEDYHERFIMPNGFEASHWFIMAMVLHIMLTGMVAFAVSFEQRDAKDQALRPKSSLYERFSPYIILLLFFAAVYSICFARLLPSLAPWAGGQSDNFVYVFTDYGSVEGDIIESDADSYVLLLPSVNHEFSKGLRIPRRVVRFICEAGEFDTKTKHLTPTIIKYLEDNKVSQSVKPEIEFDTHQLQSAQPTKAAISALPGSSHNVMLGKAKANDSKNNSNDKQGPNTNTNQH